MGHTDDGLFNHISDLINSQGDADGALSDLDGSNGDADGAMSDLDDSDGDLNSNIY